MPKNRSDLEFAIGKLIAAVQRIWQNECGLPEAEKSLAVMYRCHSLLQAAKSNDMTGYLKGRSVAGYIGGLWLSGHPETGPYVEAVETAMIKLLH